MPAPLTAASMHVSLPMYNLPEMRDVNAAIWEAVRLELSRAGGSTARTDQPLNPDES